MSNKLVRELTPEEPRRIQPQVKRYNYQFIGGCPDHCIEVKATGSTFTGGRVEFHQCAPFSAELMRSAITLYQSRILPAATAPAYDRFAYALADALMAGAASSGDVIDPKSIKLEVVGD